MVETRAGVQIRDGDLATLVSWTRSPSDPRRGGIAGPHRVRLRSRGGHLAGRQTPQGLAPGGDRLARALPRRRARGPARRAALGAAADGGRPRTVDEAE